MTSSAQLEAIRAEIAQDVSQSAYQCELEYHLDYLLSEMQNGTSEVNQYEEDLVFA